MSGLELPKIVPTDDPENMVEEEIIEEEEPMPVIKEKEYVVPDEVFKKAEEYEQHLAVPVVKKVRKKRTMTPEMLEKLAVARQKANETRKKNKELRKKGELKTPTQVKEEKKKEIEEKKRPVINNVTNEYKTITNNNNLTSEEIERISQEATAKALLIYEQKRQERKAEKKARLELEQKQQEMNKTINLALNGGLNFSGGGYKKKNSIWG
tara:strand:+ start:389 stop:1018 length:630 start_codon:yes stop_codon:yes gene_type:complete